MVALGGKYNDAELRRMYEIEKLSTPEISARDGRSATTINSRLKNMGVTMRTLKETTRAHAEKVMIPIPPRWELIAFIQKNYTVHTLCEHYKKVLNRPISTTTVRRWLVKLGLDDLMSKTYK
jgi:hypothetical protein